MTDFMEGDVVVHQDGDLPEVVKSVEVLWSNDDLGQWSITYLQTTLRFRPAYEFTKTHLGVVP